MREVMRVPCGIHLVIGVMVVMTTPVNLMAMVEGIGT